MYGRDLFVRREVRPVFSGYDVDDFLEKIWDVTDDAFGDLELAGVAGKRVHSLLTSPSVRAFVQFCRASGNEYVPLTVYRDAEGDDHVVQLSCKLKSGSFDAVFVDDPLRREVRVGVFGANMSVVAVSDSDKLACVHEDGKLVCAVKGDLGIVLDGDGRLSVERVSYEDVVKKSLKEWSR